MTDTPPERESYPHPHTRSRLGDTPCATRVLVCRAVVTFIGHEEPALRTDSNYIARIDLAPFELAGQIEQVWLRRAGEDQAVLCCVPFRAYGLALRDTVRLSAENMVIGLVRRSGNRVLRALLLEAAPDVLGELGARIDALNSLAGLLYEWSGDRHVAIDVPPGGDAEALMDLFDVEEEAGRLVWEWADVVSFRV